MLEHVQSDHRFNFAIAEHAQLRVVLKICELCRTVFTSDRDEDLHPGEYINLFRGAGHREPSVCQSCRYAPEPSEQLEGIRKSVEIAREIRRQQAALQKPSPLRQSRIEKFDTRKVSAQRARRRYYTKWQIPLVKALNERGRLTLAQMNAVTKLHVRYAGYYQRVVPDLVMVEKPRGLGQGKGTLVAKYGLRGASSVTRQSSKETIH